MSDAWCDAMTTTAFDVASDPRSKIVAAKQAGVTTIFGYVSSISPHGPKCWTPERMQVMAANGMYAGIVHEGFGGTHNKGVSREDGLRDGPYSRDQMAPLGAHKGAACYFACDTDFSNRAGTVDSLVLPYFEAIMGAFHGSGYRIGIYGDGDACEAVKTRGLVDLTWLANARAWAGYARWQPRADIVQLLPANVVGLDVDPDVIQPGRDVGTFIPFAQHPPILVTADQPPNVGSFVARWLHRS